MKRLPFCTLVVSISMLVVPACAQAGADDGKPSKEQVLQFLDLIQAKQRMVQMLDGIKTAQKKGAEEGFKGAVPDATAAQLAKVDAIADESLRDMPLDEVFDAMVPIYQNHLTSADLDAVVAFYRSPAGQKLLREQPAMMAESMQAGQDIMLKKLPEILDRLKARVAQLAEQEKTKKGDSAAPQPN